MVELLISIGIIIVLLSILLPTISKVRGQSRTTKCLSNLRQVGQAFRGYASAYQGAWPAAVHNYANQAFPLPNLTERRWYDLIGPFVTDRKMSGYIDVKLLRRDSVVWGCPEYAKTVDLEGTDPNNPNTYVNDELRPGYGMNSYGLYWDKRDAGGSSTEWTKWMPQFSSTVTGRYLRAEQWTHPQERVLVADCAFHVLIIPPTFGDVTKWPPYDPPSTAADNFSAEARHGEAALKPRASDGTPNVAYKLLSRELPCVGTLYCDGHAALMTVPDVWKGIRNPTGDGSRELPR